jgi:hypothetical protein
VLEVLYRDGTEDGVERSRLQWEGLVLVQIPDEPLVETVVGREFVPVQPVAHHAPEVGVREVGRPGAHRVEDPVPCRQAFVVQCGQPVDERVVDVDDEPWLAVERGVVALVDFASIRRGKDRLVRDVGTPGSGTSHDPS